ncbi:DeoR/GlpR transcriptional regulator, partial [Enterococcus faecalis]
AFDCLITDKHCSSTLITELRKTGLKVIQVD